MPGAHFYSGGLLRMAYEAADRAKQTAKDNLTDDTLLAIVLAASAAEGFINDVAGTIQFVSEIPGRRTDPSFARILRISGVLASLEDDKAQALSRYLCAGILLDLKDFTAGQEPIQSFRQVLQLRNAVAHPKPVSTEANDSLSKTVASLAQRGLCQPIDDSKRNTMDAETWWVVMRTPAVAFWAVHTVNRVMLSLMDGVVAIGDYKGVLTGWRNWLRKSLEAGKAAPPEPPPQG
jgi:hypothetical protein